MHQLDGGWAHTENIPLLIREQMLALGLWSSYKQKNKRNWEIVVCSVFRFVFDLLVRLVFDRFQAQTAYSQNTPEIWSSVEQDGARADPRSAGLPGQILHHNVSKT